jgi:hypothetical protein
MPAGFDNGPRLLVAGDPAIENGDRIFIEACYTLSWPTRAVVGRKDGLARMVLSLVDTLCMRHSRC